MAGPELRGTLGLGEFEQLSFEPGVAGSTFIDYDAPLVDRLSTIVNGLGRVARVRPPAIARKTIDAAAAIDRASPSTMASIAITATPPSTPRTSVRCSSTPCWPMNDGRHGHHLGQPSDAINGEFRIANQSNVTPGR